MKKIFFLVSCFFSLSLQAQNPTLLVGKRWALHHLVEQFKNNTDTLARFADCQEEFIEFFSDGKFDSPKLDAYGYWQLQDSVLLLKNHKNKNYRRLIVRQLDEKDMVLVEKNPHDVFLEHYVPCEQLLEPDDRQVFTVVRTLGLVAGWQQFDRSVAEIGIANGIFEWDNNFYALSLNAEIGQSLYGASLNAWSEDILAYGVGLTTYNNTKNWFFGLRPMFGFSANRFLKRKGFTGHLVYSYNLLFGQERSSDINRHAITLRVHIPLKKLIYEVRKKLK